MASETLRGLWQRELQDLYSTEQRIIAALPEMINGATSTQLRAALEKHLQRTKVQLERLDLILKQSGLEKIGTTRTSGIESLLRSASEMIRQQDAVEVRDAAIIGAAQHV